MDFFQQQETARRKTGLLVFYFVVAVVLIIVLVYAILAGIFLASGTRLVGRLTTSWHGSGIRASSRSSRSARSP